MRVLLKDPKLSDKIRSRALSQLGWDLSYYDLEEGLKYAEEAIALAKSKNIIVEEAHALNVAGTIYTDLGNYPMAMDYLLRSSKLYASAKDKKGEAIAAGNLGIVYTRRGQYRQALKEYFIDYHFFKGIISENYFIL